MVRKRRAIAAILLFLAVAVVACGGGSGSSPARGIDQGKVAVDFRLQDLDGQEVALSEYQGRVVMVNFWATWCPPCRAEIPDIEAAYRARREDGLVVLGVSVEQTRDHVAAFVNAVGMSYPVLLDESAQVYKMYRVPGLPMSLFLDREGVIQVLHVGPMTAAQLDGYLAELLP
jgi:peroxiredoxin